jgi:hypothetical protein
MKLTYRIDLARVDQLGQVVQHLAPQLRLVPCLQQMPTTINLPFGSFDNVKRRNSFDLVAFVKNKTTQKMLLKHIFNN